MAETDLSRLSLSELSGLTETTDYVALDAIAQEAFNRVYLTDPTQTSADTADALRAAASLAMSIDQRLPDDFFITQNAPLTDGSETTA